MLELFQGNRLRPEGGLAFPGFRRVREGLQRNIERVQLYRVENPMAVNAGHPLVKLIMSFNVPLSLDPQRYYDHAADAAYRLARTHGFTSFVSTGRAFEPGMFYGPEVTEVILAHDEEPDLRNIESQWRQLVPARVLAHPQTDLMCQVPDGRFPSIEHGYAVISLNLPVLALKYRMWRNWERGSLGSDNPQTVMQFLQAHVFPVLLVSHVNVALWNRFMAIHRGETMPERVKNRHPFHLTDWAPEADNTLREYGKFVTNRQMSFNQILGNFPTVDLADLGETVKLPDMPYSRQTTWASVLAHLRMVRYLVQHNAYHQNPRNRPTLNYLEVYFRKLRSDKSLYLPMPVWLQYETRDYIENEIRPFL